MKPSDFYVKAMELLIPEAGWRVTNDIINLSECPTNVTETQIIEKANELFELDLNKAAAGADHLIDECIGHDLPQHVAEVILEMVFQLGTNGVRKFKKMWKAMRVKDWKKAAEEMKDSRWHSQTPKRCESLAEIVANT